MRGRHLVNCRFTHLDLQCLFRYSNLPFLVVCWQKSLLRPAHSKNTGLGRVDDGWEVLDSKHAQIWDGKGATLKKKESHLAENIEQMPLLIKQTPIYPKIIKKSLLTWNSWGCSLPSRALAANEDTSLQMDARPLVWALKTMGVIRPLGVLTATLTSTTWFLWRTHGNPKISDQQ